MSQKIENTKLAYLKLDFSERQEIQKWIKDYEESTIEKRGAIKESFNKSLGPRANATCQYCGK